MGGWFVEALCLDHEVAVYDRIPARLKYFFHSKKLLSHQEVRDFGPELVINAVNLQHTMQAFEEIMTLVPAGCTISDIASVKNGLHDFYREKGYPYVSTHPMFGPTFANIRDLKNHNAIIISESDEKGKEFFRKFYGELGLNIFEYSFEEHDQIIAYSLSVPFVSTMVFSACMKKLEVPGTTFRKHLEIADGLLSEDNYLLSEILLNPYTYEQVERIRGRLTDVLEMIAKKQTDELHLFFDHLRENIGMKKQPG